MDNAAKALLIAGGILLAILTTGLLMYLWTQAGNFTTEAQEAKRLEQLVAFNKQYEAYQRKALRGNDVASVINKVRSNNKKYPDESITWKFVLQKKIIDVLPAGTYTENNSDMYDLMTKDTDDFKEFKRLYFECTKITYNSETGKVNSIEFKEITYERIEQLFNSVS